MRRYLIVANQTLGTDTLAEAVSERVAGGPCEFWILVPATAAADLATASFPAMGGVPVSVHASPTAARMLAQKRLDAAVERLRADGAVVGGEVGDPDPLHAIEQCLTGQQIDEIVVATLPGRISRWLHQDLPGRAERKFHLPVTHLESPTAPGTTASP